MFTTQGGIRELKGGLDCPLVVPTFLGEQNPEQAVRVLVSRSSHSCHSSTTTFTFPSFPAALYAVCCISQILHYRPYLAIYFQCCTCDDDYSYTNAHHKKNPARYLKEELYKSE